jgi:hypothetical protein
MFDHIISLITIAVLFKRLYSEINILSQAYKIDLHHVCSFISHHTQLGHLHSTSLAFFLFFPQAMSI